MSTASQTGNEENNPPNTVSSQLPLLNAGKKVLAQQRKERSRLYNKTLSAASDAFRETTNLIAGTHHKSVNHVRSDLGLVSYRLATKRKANSWNAFNKEKAAEKRAEGQALRGQLGLPSLAKASREEYNTLNAEEKEALAKKWDEDKKNEDIVRSTSGHSKVMIISKTFDSIMKDLNTVSKNTNAQALLIVVRGSTDFVMNGQYYATEGVTDFISDTLKMDPQDLVTRFEGYALQGLVGASEEHGNHQSRLTKARSELRDIIKKNLQDVTKNPKAKMSWKNFIYDIVQSYRIDIFGWPDNIRFGDLSTVVTNIRDIEALRNSWKNGTTGFRKLTDAEVEERMAKHRRQLATGEIQEQPRQPRSDKGKKRAREDDSENNGAGPSTQQKRRKVLSDEFVNSDESDEEEEGL